MNARIETTSIAESCQAIMIDLDTCRPEYQQSTPSSGVSGISSSPLHLLRRTTLVAGIAVIGTIPLPVEDIDPMPNGIEAIFVFPSSPDSAAKDEYSRIREEMVAS